VNTTGQCLWRDLLQWSFCCKPPSSLLYILGTRLL
jgi:hypothetical protein